MIPSELAARAYKLEWSLLADLLRIKPKRAEKAAAKREVDDQDSVATEPSKRRKTGRNDDEPAAQAIHHAPLDIGTCIWVAGPHRQPESKGRQKFIAALKASCAQSDSRVFSIGKVVLRKSQWSGVGIEVPGIDGIPFWTKGHFAWEDPNDLHRKGEKQGWLHAAIDASAYDDGAIILEAKLDIQLLSDDDVAMAEGEDEDEDNSDELEEVDAPVKLPTPFNFLLTVSLSLKQSSDSKSALWVDPAILDITLPKPRMPSHWTGSTDISFFYNSLRPPALPTPHPVGDPKGKGKARETMNLDVAEVRPFGLVSDLMPFQQRSVRWLLRREGKQVVETDPSGFSMIDTLSDDDLEIVKRGPLWQRQEIGGKAVWVNRVLSQMAFADPVKWPLEEAEGLQGSGFGSALLSEEMGLGKTLMVLSLCLLNQARERAEMPSYYLDSLDTDVQPTGLTLIICPLTISQQWMEEIAKHAPALKVYRYEASPFISPKANGIKKVPLKWGPAYFAENYQIVLTTFDVLRREIFVARKPHERGTRSAVRGERPQYRRSLLTQIEWWRVCTDEVQLMEGSASAASETASLIPRRLSLAISGTPIASKLWDFECVLKFLRVHPFDTSSSLFRMLLTPRLAPDFARFVSSIGIRTLKADVAEELALPKQTRFLVPIELSAVERYSYQQTYAEALADLGFTEEGDPPAELDRQRMNHWLLALRQAVVHPQVGEAGRRILGGTIKTVDEVLGTLIDLNRSALDVDIRSLWASRVRRAHLTMFDRENCERFEIAISLLDPARDALVALCDEIRADIKTTRQQERQERARVRSGEATPMTTDSDEDGHAFSLLDEEVGANTGGSQTAIRLHKHLTGLTNRLYDTTKVLHQAIFFTGNCYYAMGKFEKEEKASYDAAEALRTEVLAPAEKRAAHRAAIVKKQLEPALQIDELEIGFTDEPSAGLQSQLHFENISDSTSLLNGYAELLFEWRQMLVDLLLKPVSLEDDAELDAAYENAGSTQETLDVVTEQYTALLSEWHQLLTGAKLHNAAHLQGTAGVIQAHRGVSHFRAEILSGPRKRTGADKDAADLREDASDRAAMALRKSLMRKRRDVRNSVDAKQPSTLQESLKALKQIAERPNQREEEKQLCEGEIRRLRKEMAAKVAVADRLSTELRAFDAAYNSRVVYYARLQVFSDTVRDIDFFDRRFKGIEEELHFAQESEDRAEPSIAEKKARTRYLDFLKEQNEGMSDDERTCGVCLDPVSEGYLTHCGHLFCSGCFKEWTARHRTCPLCKSLLHRGSFSRISLEDKNKRKEERAAPAKVLARLSGGSTSSLLGAGLSQGRIDAVADTLSRDEVAAIDEFTVAASWSSKVDFVVQHIKSILHEAPDAKIVVFSGFSGALDILEIAFRQNALEYRTLQSHAGRKDKAIKDFTTDPNVNVLCLHAQSQSAGLTLTCAQTIIMVEPLLTASHELQAVARIQRFGQRSETQVFQYVVQESVEHRIADLARSHGRSLFVGADTTSALVTDLASKASSPRKSASKVEDSRAVGDADLATILFESKERKLLERAVRI